MKASRIAERLQISLFEANVALSIIRCRINPENFPKRFPRTCGWVQKCYHKPRLNEIALEALDELLKTYGVEAIHDERFHRPFDSYFGDIVASYLNNGDTYATTIVLDHIDDRWRLMSWGDFVEGLDEKAEKEEQYVCQ
jgi:hypothetical protein